MASIWVAIGIWPCARKGVSLLYLDRAIVDVWAPLIYSMEACGECIQYNNIGSIYNYNGSSSWTVRLSIISRSYFKSILHPPFYYKTSDLFPQAKNRDEDLAISIQALFLIKMNVNIKVDTMKIRRGVWALQMILSRVSDYCGARVSEFYDLPHS